MSSVFTERNKSIYNFSCNGFRRDDVSFIHLLVSRYRCYFLVLMMFQVKRKVSRVWLANIPLLPSK